MTVGELEQRATSKEISEWMMFYKIKNEDWEKEHPKKPTKSSDPVQLGNELAAALKGYKR